MKCILSNSSDPYFNLAAEEYLLKNFDENFYFQYLNTDSVVVGKHQNALGEINIDYLQENKITLARRISGGGAVYHDKGNLNYAFITNEAPGDFIKFGKYTAPIISALKELGIEASLGKRNEILVGKEKISGTASHVFKTRVLHHGTLLFSADLDKLSSCLYKNIQKYNDKAVKSVRSDVVNISTLMQKEIAADEFSAFIISYIIKLVPSNEYYSFSTHDLDAINQLIRDKFSKWDWNYGYSPKYMVERKLVLGESSLNLRTEVVKGVITSIDTEGALKEDSLLLPVFETLYGIKHEKGCVKRRLEESNLKASEIIYIMDGLF